MASPIFNDSYLKVAKAKTVQLYLASIPSALLDLCKGIRVEAN